MLLCNIRQNKYIFVNDYTVASVTLTDIHIFECYVCIALNVSVCMHACAYIVMCICVCVCVYVCVCVRACVRACVCVQARVDVYVLGCYMCAHASVLVSSHLQSVSRT